MVISNMAMPEPSRAENGYYVNQFEQLAKMPLNNERIYKVNVMSFSFYCGESCFKFKISGVAKQSVGHI